MFNKTTIYQYEQGVTGGINAIEKPCFVVNIH